MAARRSAADELDEATRAQADPDYLFFLSHLYPDVGGTSSSCYVLDIPDLDVVVRYGPFVIGDGAGIDGDDASTRTGPPPSVVIGLPPPPPSARDVEVDSAPTRSNVASNGDDEDGAAGTDDDEEVNEDGSAAEGPEEVADEEEEGQMAGK